MDSSSPLFIPSSPIELEELERKAKVTLSQLLDHVRKADQRAEFVQSNPPVPSVASDPPSHFSSNMTSKSKRTGLILVTQDINVWSEDSEPATASSIGSVGWRSISGRALRGDSSHDTRCFPNRHGSIASPARTSTRKRTKHGARGRKLPLAKHYKPSIRKVPLNSCWWDDETDGEQEDEEEEEIAPPIPVMERRHQSRIALSPSKRSAENHLMTPFDPSFSFTRLCVNSPDKTVDPLDNWFASPVYSLSTDTSPF